MSRHRFAPASLLIQNIGVILFNRINIIQNIGVILFNIINIIQNIGIILLNRIKGT